MTRRVPTGYLPNSVFKCSRKRQFSDQESADQWSAEHPLIFTEPTRAYKCDICGSWHLTHGKKSKKVPRARQAT
jgi:hypothetical protein